MIRTLFFVSLCLIFYFPQVLISDEIDSLLVNDAKCMSQSLSENGIFDDDFLINLVSVLKKIHIKFPEISNIHSKSGVYNNINPIIIDEPNNPFKYRHQNSLYLIDQINIYLNRQTTIKILSFLQKDTTQTFITYDIVETGIKNIDELNKKYSALKLKYHISKDNSRSSLLIVFKQKLDILKLIEIYSALPEVIDAQVNWYIGCVKKSIYFIKKEPFWYFVFRDGWEETGFGCQYNRYYYFTYDLESRKIEKNDELFLDFHNIKELRKKSKIWYFGIPKIRFVRVFKNFNALFDKAKSDTWWEKIYALDVLGFLMLPKFVRSNVDDQNQVDEIRNEVLANRKEIISLFISNLSCPDRDISKTVYTYLRLISSNSYSINDIESWENWFIEHYQIGP